MATSNSVDELVQTLKDTYEGCDEVKMAYTIGYLKGLLSAYVPQDVIDSHLNSLKIDA